MALEVGDFDSSHPPKDKVLDRAQANLLNHLRDEKRHESAETLKTAALRLIKECEYNKAIKYLEAITSAEPVNREYVAALRDAHLQYGDYLKDRQDTKGARSEYQKALLVDKRSEGARERLKKLNVGHT